MLQAALERHLLLPLYHRKLHPPAACPSSSSLHTGHNPDCNLSPHAPKTLLTLMVMQLSLSKPRGPGSPASTCSSTSCRQTHCFHDLVAFLTSPPFLYSQWLCETWSTTLGAKKEAPFCRGWLLPLYFRWQPHAGFQKKPCSQQFLDSSRIQYLLCISHSHWAGWSSEASTPSLGQDFSSLTDESPLLSLVLLYL